MAYLAAMLSLLASKGPVEEVAGQNKRHIGHTEISVPVTVL